MELLNPGGSIKDRPALFMLQEGLKSGVINKDSHIVESSSGELSDCACNGLQNIWIKIYCRY